MERFDKKRKKSRFDLRDIVTKYEKGIAVNNTILGLGMCFLSQPVTKPTTMIDDQQVDTVKEVKLLGLVKWSDLKGNTYIDATVNLRLGTLAISAARATRKGQTIGLYNTCTWECDEERTNNRFIQYLQVGMHLVYNLARSCWRTSLCDDDLSDV